MASSRKSESVQNLEAQSSSGMVEAVREVHHHHEPVENITSPEKVDEPAL
jgi:hypothetical protein